jgi:hypothetical protein
MSDYMYVRNVRLRAFATVEKITETQLRFFLELFNLSCRTKVAVKSAGCLHWRFQKIAVEIAVKIASVNRP